MGGLSGVGVAAAAGLKGVKVCHMHTEGPAPYADPDCQGIFETSCFFVGSNLRKAVADGEQGGREGARGPTRRRRMTGPAAGLPLSLSHGSSSSTGRAEYVPIYLSEIPNLFRRSILPVDVAMVQVSPPDKHGYCSLGRCQGREGSGHCYPAS